MKDTANIAREDVKDANVFIKVSLFSLLVLSFTLIILNRHARIRSPE